MTEQRYCKRLIEVDLPIKRISEHARREKSIRHGHISTLHGYWARRPLAACRAVLCATLWLDPADDLCPNQLKQETARLLKEFRDRRGGKKRDLNDSIQLREALFDFIVDFSNWDNASNIDFLNLSSALTRLSHSLSSSHSTEPLVVDPFSGGGSIPIEGLRVGANVVAADYNPVAVLLLKTMIEWIPQYGDALIHKVKELSSKVKKAVLEEVGKYYPVDENKGIPIAYIWARTIICEGPNCGAEVPLIRSLWLSKKRKIAMDFSVDRQKKKVAFSILNNVKDNQVKAGTVKRGAALCPVCGFITAVQSVRKQSKARGLIPRLLCVITRMANVEGKGYRLPNSKDLEALKMASLDLNKLRSVKHNGLSLIPDEEVDQEDTFNLRMAVYGMKTWGELFTERQLLVLTRLVKKISELPNDSEFSLAASIILALAVDRLAAYCNNLSVWVPRGEYMGSIMAMQAIQMKWDFAEINPFSGATGEFDGAVEWIEKVAQHILSSKIRKGTVIYASATNLPLPDNSVDVLFTDPPYYNNIEYCGLSDFYYVWLKRGIGEKLPDLFRDKLISKEEEIVQNEAHKLKDGTIKDGAFYEKNMTLALSRCREVLKEDGYCIVVFSHTSTEGWEAMLNAVLTAGFVISSSWPIDTEMEARTNVRSQAGAVLASSVHLVCRSRSINASVGDWRDVLQELPKRIHEWMPRLAQEGVVGADAIFACLGPALEVFSKYSRVEKANGEKVELKEYLEQVWGAVAKEALNMIFQGAKTEGLEEDARLTAMWLWTLSTADNGNNIHQVNEDENQEDEESSSPKMSGFTLEYDAARKIAQGLGVHLEELVGVIRIDHEKATLLSVSERVQHLFGKGSMSATPGRKKKKENQMTLFEEFNKVEEQGWSLGDEKSAVGKTILDRLHQAMILFGAGRGDAMRRFLAEEGIGKDERFWRLAQAFSALYPPNTDEKRWVDGVLARKKSLGF